MKAVILAAGKATRLRPVTLTMPKALVPVANKTLIGYAFDVLKAAGIHEIGIVVNDLDSPIPNILKDGNGLGVRLQYILQEEQKGLAHAVGLCQDFVGDESFCVFLGDNVFQDKMTSFFAGFEQSTSEAAIVVGEVNDPTRFGIAELNADGSIHRVVEKPKEPKSNLAISGVYLFRKSIFDAISRIGPSHRNEYEITDAIQRVVDDGKRVTTYSLQGWWIDAGKPDSIILANQLVLEELPYTPAPEKHPQITNSEVGHRVVLGAGSQIIDSVVRGPVIIGENTIIQNSYVGPYTAVGDNVTIEGSEIEASIVMKNSVIRNIQGRIDSSLLADNSQLIAAANRIPATKRFVLAENSYVQF
jgi:glucose-1-phosphate thymidylyltransferase